MRILHVINTLDVGGAEKLLTDICCVTKEKGHEVEVLVLKSSETIFTKRLISKGIKIISTENKGFISYKILIWLKENLCNYDIVHSHLSYSQYYVALLKVFNKKKKIVTTEHNTFNKRRKYLVFKLLEKCIYKQYNAIITINNETKNSIEEWQPKIRDKVYVVNNGINIEHYIEKSNVVRSKKNAINILMVAAFREQKDQDTLLRSIAILPPNYNVWFVGKGEREDAVRGLAKELGILNRVEFLGIREDIPELMGEADIFVLSSHWEGFGLVVVEAMASGLPVIASNVKGLASVVNGAGLLFEPQDYEELSEKIKLIAEDEILRNNLICKGRRRVEEYDILRNVDELINLYMKL